MPTLNKIRPDRVRAMLASDTPPAALASALGVSHSSVSYWRKKLGLPPADQRTISRKRVAELHARGWADEAIAAELGCHRTGVGKVRRSLGLPAHRSKSETFAPKMRAHYLRRTAAAGVRSLRQLNPDAYRRNSRSLARRYGLPDDLFRVQVRVVLALAGGPRTAAQLAGDTGRGQPRINGYHRFGCPHCPSGNYLTDLVRRGIVLAVRQPGRRPTRTYLLTAAAIDMLSAAPKEARA